MKKRKAVDVAKLGEELIDTERRRMARLLRERRITLRQAVDVMMDTRQVLYGTGEPVSFVGVIKATGD